MSLVAGAGRDQSVGMPDARDGGADRAAAEDLRVRAPTRHERPAAVTVLVQALAEDPGWAAVVPDRRRRAVVLHGLLATVVTDAAAHARVAVAAGEVLGAAVWQPPGRYPMSTGRRLRAVARMAGTAVRVGRSMQAVVRFGSAVDAAFPAHPVRYLQVLGVAPAVQGRGVGAALLDEGLAVADRAGQDTYLETAREANVTFYARRGFAPLADGAPIGHGQPVMWRMARPPSGGAGTG